jgi:hypothetical protein
MAQVGGGGVDGAVLQVDEEEVEAGVRQHLDDLDARHSHQDAEGRFTFPPEHPQAVQRLALLRLLGVGRPLLAHLAAPGTYELYCPVDGHAEEGMEGELTVKEGSGGAGGY